VIKELAELPRWVAWKNEQRKHPDGSPRFGADGQPAMTKIPYNPRGGMGDSTSPATWGTLEEAERRAETMDGVGINLGDLGNGSVLSGIDLDTCLSEDGVLEPWAAEVVERFASYTEVSPSGRGLKTFFLLKVVDYTVLREKLGNKDGAKWAKGTGREHPPAIELYLARRYFTVTWQQHGFCDYLRVVPATDPAH
jgi:hypothetical protein